MSFFNFDDNCSSNKDSSFFDDIEDTRAGQKHSSSNKDSSFFVDMEETNAGKKRSSSNKDSSFFGDMEDTGAGEKRSSFDLDAAGGGDGSNSSDVKMKAPTSKKSKVDPSPSKVKQASTQEALLTITDRDVKENPKSIKIKKNEGKTHPSDILRDSIEEMRSKMLTMIPDIKRQEEAGDSVMARATVLKSDLQDYGEQLVEVKHEYTSRLNQISSILSRPH